MNVKFIGQGFEEKSEFAIGKLLAKFLADKQFHTFTGITAFTGQSAVNRLSSNINAAKKHFKNITIVTGVNLDGTSKEALEALLNLKINVYVFYQTSTNYIIFHPKIYLFEGEDKSELIIGSSNLTSSGLFTNVETSLLISIDNSLKEDRKVIEQLKDYFKGIFDLTDPNIQKITKKIIDDFSKAKLVPTEAQRRATRYKVKNPELDEALKVISQIFPKRAIAKIPIEFRIKNQAKVKEDEVIEVPSDEPTAKGSLVWTRRSLPSSSVQVSKSGTNPTGGLRLVQDDFSINKKKINQTTYFRYKLFGKYLWTEIKESPFVEAAIIPFEITISDDYMGRFELEVRHKPSGEAKQGNYTTSISWGAISPIIREAKLTGSRLDIYAPKEKGSPFHIVIT